MNARERSNHLAALLRNERSAMADFLLDLADFDRQRVWRELGHASLFSYLRRELGLSAGAAQYRKTAAELAPAETPAGAPSEPLPPAAATAVPRDTAKPLHGGASRLHVTVSRRFLSKLEAAKDAFSHAKSGATAEEILEAGLDLLLARQAKRKGLVEKPRKAPPPSRSDAVPAHVKREGLDTRRRPLPVATRIRWRLRVDAPRRIRSPGSAGARRPINDRQRSHPMPRP